MIVRNLPNGEQLVLGKRIIRGWRAGSPRTGGTGPLPRSSRTSRWCAAATFHDFGYLRYETAPAFNAETQQTPNFRDVVTDDKRLQEYQQTFDWFLGPDPYAATLARAHRTGLWRGRYDAVVHPPHKIRQQPPAVDAFVEKNEAIRDQAIAEHGWDKQQFRVNYRLLQVWDLMSLYFSCGEPYDEYIEPVPTRYTDQDGEGVRITFTPLDATDGGARSVSVRRSAVAHSAPGETLPQGDVPRSRRVHEGVLPSADRAARVHADRRRRAQRRRSDVGRSGIAVD